MIHRKGKAIFLKIKILRSGSLWCLMQRFVLLNYSITLNSKKFVSLDFIINIDVVPQFAIPRAFKIFQKKTNKKTPKKQPDLLEYIIVNNLILIKCTNGVIYILTAKNLEPRKHYM